MDNHKAVEKLSSSFLKFLDSKNIKNVEYKVFETMGTEQKLSFLATYIKPKKNSMDMLVVDMVERR